MRVVNWLKSVTGFKKAGSEADSGRYSAVAHGEPRIVAREAHPISRKQISQAALKVLYGLKDAGYQAYLVGGGVRDLLLGREPKDFDIATDAHPHEVKRIFHRARLIGRRFVIVHVYSGGDIVEVATFRGSGTPDEVADEDDGEGDAVLLKNEHGRVLADNVYGNMEEDAFRRDFSVNALFYNIADFSIVDYVGGMEDLRAGQLRLIGDPEQRYREDPVRMLRAARFAAKLGFRMHPATEAPIVRLAHLLGGVPAARLLDECQKLFLSGHGLQSYESLRHYGLFSYLFPELDAFLASAEQDVTRSMPYLALQGTDERIQAGKSINPAFLFAAFLWTPFQTRLAALRASGLDPLEALQRAEDQTLHQQRQSVMLPKRYTATMREIWSMQSRFERRTGRRPYAFLVHPRFRAAYDFLLLRADCGDADAALAQWWTEFQAAGEIGRQDMVAQSKRQPSEAANGIATVDAAPRRKRRRRRRSKSKTEPQAPDAATD